MPRQYRPPSGYLTIGDAAQTLGVTDSAVRSLIRRYRLPVYRDARNGLVRLLRQADVEALLQPSTEADLQRVDIEEDRHEEAAQ